MNGSKWIAALALAAASGAVLAADEGVYLGAGLGDAKARGTGLTKSSDTALKIFAGYQFNKHVGIEGEFVKLEKLEDAGATYKAMGWGLAAIGAWPIKDNILLYGKLGIMQTTTDTNPVAGSAVLFARQYKTSGAFGLGGQFNIDPNTGIRLGWDRYKVPIATANDMNVYSVAAVFKF